MITCAPGKPSINIDEVLKGINESAKGNPYSVCIAAESEELNDVNLPYFSFRSNFPLKLMIGNGCNPLFFDYVIIGPIDNSSWRAKLFEGTKQALLKNNEKFKLVKEIRDIRIYQKI